MEVEWSTMPLIEKFICSPLKLQLFMSIIFLTPLLLVTNYFLLLFFIISQYYYYLAKQKLND